MMYYGALVHRTTMYDGKKTGERHGCTGGVLQVCTYVHVVRYCVISSLLLSLITYNTVLRYCIISHLVHIQVYIYIYIILSFWLFFFSRGRSIDPSKIENPLPSLLLLFCTCDVHYPCASPHRSIHPPSPRTHKYIYYVLVLCTCIYIHSTSYTVDAHTQKTQKAKSKLFFCDVSLSYSYIYIYIYIYPHARTHQGASLHARTPRAPNTLLLSLAMCRPAHPPVCTACCMYTIAAPILHHTTPHQTAPNSSRHAGRHQPTSRAASERLAELLRPW